MTERRLISYERDIYQQVSDLSDGKFTPKQVQLLWESVISYIYFLVRYTPIVKIRLPLIGDLYVNLKEMEHRVKVLEGIKEENHKFTEKQEAEYIALIGKIKAIKEEDKKGRLKKRNFYMASMRDRVRHYKQGFDLEQIEDFQYSKF